MRLSVSLVALFIQAVLPAVAEAWSSPGHEAVCQIAFLELGKTNPDVQKKVNQIMSRETDTKFKPFATACTWADEPAQKNARRLEHFVNVDRNLQAITTETCTHDCLFSAITDDSSKLKNSTGQAQLQALKYLGHWIGDLHQPLHVSYADDRGGNEIPVTGADECNELHGTWDRCIPEAVRKDVGATTGATDLGTKLEAQITDAERTKWRQGTIVEWAEESYAVTRKPDTKYCLMDGTSCCYDTSSCKNTAGDDKAKQTKRLVPLPSGYEQGEVDTAKEQLKKAGVRLAVLLETELQ